MKIIKNDLLYEDAKKLEIKLIQLIGRIDLDTGPLTNLTNGGEGQSCISQQTIEKIRKKNKINFSGEKNPRYGVKISKEQKQKQRNSLLKRYANGLNVPFKGKKHSEETKQKIRGLRLGKKTSLKTRLKMSESHKAENLSRETRKKLSTALKGKNNPMYGKKHSKDSIEKMKQAKAKRVYEKICGCGVCFKARASNAKYCNNCR